MKINLKYGKEEIVGNLPEQNILGVIQPNPKEGLSDQLEAVQTALDHPISSPSIEQLIKNKKPQKVVIVVNDTTRPTPYEYMLPPLLGRLEKAGIGRKQIIFVIATGIHRPNTEQENVKDFTREIADNYQFINHNCDQDLVNIGKLANGMDLMINRQVAEADLLITTGLINLHYIAGYSGGRKSILPGVVSRELITANHSMMTDLRAYSGHVDDNPVHHLMIEAARMADVDFVVNVVTNEKKEIVKVVAGDLEKAWIAGTKECEKMNIVKINQKADAVFASAGGYPKDVNVYQAQKALENASHAVKDGGTIILAAQCLEGLGEKVFEEWMSQAQTVDDIFKRFDQGFVLGGHKAFAIAQVLQNKNVILISDLQQAETENMFFQYSRNLEEALKWVQQRHGQNFKAWIMPQAGSILPQTSYHD